MSDMKLFTIKTLIFFTIFSQIIFAQKTEFKVMAWNILRSGNQIENGGLTSTIRTDDQSGVPFV